MLSFEAQAGTVKFPEEPNFHNPKFGFDLWENVADPERTDGVDGIVMRVPPESVSKMWRLVKPGYSEAIEWLAGEDVIMVVYRGKTKTWERHFLTAQDPKAGGVTIGRPDCFAIVSGNTDAWVISRPSMPFDITFEEDVSRTPTDELSAFVIRIATEE